MRKIPSETGRHARTWMAWPWDGSLWNNIEGTNLKSCQDSIDRLIRTILNYEHISLLVRDIDRAELDRRFKPSAGSLYQVKLVTANYNDIWVRDTLPTFAISDLGSLLAINWNFNGWGRRISKYSSYNDDAKLCNTVAALAGAELINSGITAEGGAFVFDRNDIAIVTRSVMFDKYRNPGLAKGALEEAVVKATGRKRICWLPGDRNEPITTGHADSIIAFAGGRNVLMNWAVNEMSAEFDVCDYNLRVLQDWLENQQEKIEIVKLPASKTPAGYNYCSSYIGFVPVNDGIIIPSYGDSYSDERAARIISEAFEREIKVEFVDACAIAAAGGSLHCVTQHQPATLLA